MFRNEKIVAASLATASSAGLAMMANNLGTIAQYASASAAGALFFASLKLFYSVLLPGEEESPADD